MAQIQSRRFDFMTIMAIFTLLFILFGFAVDRINNINKDNLRVWSEMNIYNAGCRARAEGYQAAVNRYQSEWKVLASEVLE